MGIKELFSPRPPVKVREKVAKRARLLPTHEIPVWIDSSVTATGTAMRDFQRTREDFHLDEAIANAETSLSLLRVLRERVVEEP